MGVSESGIPTFTMSKCVILQDHTGQCYSLLLAMHSCIQQRAAQHPSKRLSSGSGNAVTDTDCFLLGTPNVQGWGRGTDTGKTIVEKLSTEGKLG